MTFWAGMGIFIALNLLAIWGFVMVLRRATPKSRAYRRLLKRELSIKNDLTVMHKAFSNKGVMASLKGNTAALHLQSDLKALLAHYQETFDGARELRILADSMSQVSMKTPMLQRYENTMVELEGELNTFSELSAQLHSQGSTTAQGLSSLRSQLDESLKLAERVESRMRDMDSELRGEHDI